MKMTHLIIDDSSLRKDNFTDNVTNREISMYKISPSNNSTTYNPLEISDLNSAAEKFTTPERIQYISNNNNHFTGVDAFARPLRNQPATSEHIATPAGMNVSSSAKKSIVRKKLDDRLDEIRKKLSLISFDLPAEPSSTSDYSIHRLICNSTGILFVSSPDTAPEGLKKGLATQNDVAHR
ncbi:hypothetical protein [Pantoea cypripedii]|uniref:Uncharacterized protein n=1 Tax=Pantoea cypripedii TaxID=55209 RepID=A0A6B9GA76_PANCY|nr:hypothetical protein [Pantoea cypripedii]QGY32270.1 hypothetical protein CUN67_25090 [Pantoea cypripedii]